MPQQSSPSKARSTDTAAHFTLVHASACWFIAQSQAIQRRVHWLAMFVVLLASSGLATSAAGMARNVLPSGGNLRLAVRAPGSGSVSPRLSVSSQILSFSTLMMGQASALNLTLSPSSTAPITIGSMIVSGNEFSIPPQNLPITIPPGQRLTIPVQFKPTASGAARGEIRVASGSGKQLASIFLSGSATGALVPQLTVSPASLAFGDVSLGSSAKQSITLLSSGTAPVAVNSILVSISGFSIAVVNYPVTLNPGQQLSLPVQFKPAIDGADTARITVNSTDATNPMEVVTLTGTGTGLTQPLLAVTPGSLAFGNVNMGSSATQALTLTSTGTGALTISSISAGGPGFSVQGATLPITLGPNGSLPIQVQFDPMAAGAVSGQVMIGSNSSSGANVAVNVNGSGTNPVKPVGTPITQCQAMTQGGQFYLDSDVTCTTQGFAINVDNIRFNLNGHTIYYGNPNTVVPAISICDNWYQSLPGNACGNGQHENVEVFGGSIVQNTSSAPFTHAIWIGQGNDIVGGYFHDLTITIQQTGTQAFHGDYAPVGLKIQNNTINDNVTQIEHPGQGALSARSNFQGVAIFLSSNNNNPGSGDIISGNTINGSPQGGIYDTNQNTQIYNNVIKLSSRYSNDYGVTVLADGQQVHDNTITGRGRGLDGESSRFVFNHNTINVHEEANNSEYGGCELGGSDGIRIKNYQPPSTTGAVVSNNTVTVSGQYCEANAIALSQLTGGSITISGNTFTAIPGTQSGADRSGNGYYAIRYDLVRNAAITWTANTFNADGVYIYWDGANSAVQAGQTWHLKFPQVYALDGGSGITGFSQALTVNDYISNPGVACGASSTAQIRIGSYTKGC
jgi:hypothetical protein